MSDDVDTPTPFGSRWARPEPPWGTSPISSTTTLSIIDPPELGGRRHVIGKVFVHRSRFLTWLIGTPLRWHRDFNIRRHNKRMERLAAAKRAIS